MNRLVWMGTGVLIAVIALQKLNATKSELGYAGLHRAVGRFTDGMQDFSYGVRAGMRERETELRGAFRATSALSPSND
jgi:hypothetical protein